MAAPQKGALHRQHPKPHKSTSARATALPAAVPEHSAAARGQLPPPDRQRAGHRRAGRRTLLVRTLSTLDSPVLVSTTLRGRASGRHGSFNAAGFLGRSVAARPCCRGDRATGCVRSTARREWRRGGAAVGGGVQTSRPSQAAGQPSHIAGHRVTQRCDAPHRSAAWRSTEQHPPRAGHARFGELHDVLALCSGRAPQAANACTAH